MQPNSPQPPQQYGPPPSFGLPDYMRDAAPAPQAPMPKKRLSGKTIKIAILTAIVVVLLGAGAAVAYWVWSQQYSPEAKFYRALENMMSVKYIARDYEIEPKDDTNTKVTTHAESDFSDPAKPKSLIEYTASEAGDSTVRTAREEVVILDMSEYKARLTSVDPVGAAPKNMTVGQWYRFVNPESKRKIDRYDFDSVESWFSLNSPQGIVLLGNFSIEQRSQLMDIIRTGKVYSVAKSESETKDDKRKTIYTVKVDRRGLNDLNKKATDLIGAPQVHQVPIRQDKDETFKFWVNDAGLIVKMLYTTLRAGQDPFEKMITFKSIPSLSIEEPIEVKESKN